ncbi:MAG: hypothetical protein IC227_00630 [Enterococcus lacertideformus]|uniref:Uncharacterized protein n=1 Tax=Enterococcus lacertideformus TaxID=2771493 RepID=A0A931F8Z6_9ENTE|nr:hypothetical protein [Enterococcus lacertideformus]
MWQAIPENQLKGEQIADKDKVTNVKDKDTQDKDKAIKAKGKSSVNKQSKEDQVELTVAGGWDQYKQETKNIHSKYSDLRNKISNDKDVPFRMKKQLLKNLEKHIALSKKLVVAESLDFYGQKLDSLQKTRGEILNYQNFSPKNELAKEIVQLLTSGKLPNYFEKIRENDLNFLELRDQVTKDSKLPLGEKEALVQKISSCIIADREQGYKLEMSLFSSNSKKLLALQDEISKDEELPTENKKTLNRQIRQIVKIQYEKQIFRTTINFKNLAFKIQKDSLLLEIDKHKLS